MYKLIKNFFIKDIKEELDIKRKRVTDLEFESFKLNQSLTLAQIDIENLKEENSKLKNQIDIDKNKNNKYTNDKETLIREMFPGVNYVGDYKDFNTLFELIDFSGISTFLKAIGAYYWGEVSRLTMEGKYSEIEKLQGLLHFSEDIKTFHDFIVREKASNLNTNELDS